ncbi:MAG TPA: hypothetical protein VJ731_11895 [Terriglobales bacterium]|nr:hypothetical protein [Terriglobales bacterium]
MKRSRLLILPTTGLLVFALGTAASIHMNRMRGNKNIFYWSSIPLSLHPLERRYKLVACNPPDPNCQWEPASVWVDPGPMAKVLIVSSFPAFLLGLAITRSLGHVGVSEVTTFMVSMPVFIFAWYYLVAWTCRSLLRSWPHHR